MRREGLLFIALLLARVEGVSAGRVVIDKVVALVNEEVITLSQLQQEGKPLIRRIAEELTGSARESQLQTTQRQVLDALILRRLQLQEAVKERVTVEEAEVTKTIEEIKQQNGFKSDGELVAALAQEHLTLEEFKTKIREQLIVERLLIRKVRTAVVVSEEEILQHYKATAQEFQQAPAVRLRHILIRLPDPPSPQDLTIAQARADEVFQKLKGGTAFATVAAQYSDGAAAKEGGDLGVIRQGEMDPALEAAAFALKPGEVSTLIRTAAGFNIIKVEERIAPQLAMDPKVRETIRQKLFAQKYETRLKAYLDELRQKAYIEVRLGD